MLKHQLIIRYKNQDKWVAVISAIARSQISRIEQIAQVSCLCLIQTFVFFFHRDHLRTKYKNWRTQISNFSLGVYLSPKESPIIHIFYGLHANVTIYLLNM